MSSVTFKHSSDMASWPWEARQDSGEALGPGSGMKDSALPGGPVISPALLQGALQWPAEPELALSWFLSKWFPGKALLPWEHMSNYSTCKKPLISQLGWNTSPLQSEWCLLGFYPTHDQIFE